MIVGTANFHSSDCCYVYFSCWIVKSVIRIQSQSKRLFYVVTVRDEAVVVKLYDFVTAGVG